MIKENYKKMLANYWLTSLLISVTTFLIYLFFTTKVNSLSDLNSLVVAAAMSILMGYQYASIKNTLFSIRSTFGKLSHLFKNNQYQIFSVNLENKLHKSWRFYSTIIITFTPFVILELIKVRDWKQFHEIPPFYSTTNQALISLKTETIWLALFDLFNNVSEYLILFLMSVIIWIMIELTLITKELKEKYEVNIDMFDVDETGGLKPLRSLALSVVSNYFIIISLAIISYNPVSFIPIYTYNYVSIVPEIIILILMLLISIILFIITQKTIRELVDKGVKLELKRINLKYKETCDKAIEISSIKGINDYEKELEKLRVILDFLEKEEIKVNRIKHKKYDIRAIFTFINTALLPIITLIGKIIVSIGLDKIIEFIGLYI
jgi:hypothetical protein